MKIMHCACLTNEWCTNRIKIAWRSLIVCRNERVFPVLVAWEESWWLRAIQLLSGGLNQVDVTNRTSEVDLTNYVPNGEWELLEARLIRNVVFYSCCPEPFPDLTVTLKIRRKTLYYMYNIVLPCMMMSVLTLLVFCLPPESGEKIALGVTVLLAFSVFMLAIAEKMPETSESIPLIGQIPSTFPCFHSSAAPFRSHDISQTRHLTCYNVLKLLSFVAVAISS